MTTEQETNHAFARSRSNAGLERDFEAWWESDGQFLRSGGGQYEKTFAYHAWIDSAKSEREACAKVAEEAAKKMGDIGRQHRDDGRTDSMDRCYSRSLQCTQVAADIRTRSNANITGG